MSEKKTAIYVRVSVLKEEAVSPEMQLDKAKQYCQLHDEPYEVFQDLDFSGKDTKRPAFQRMLSQIRMCFISKVVVYRLDRVSRSVKDFALFMDTLKEKEVEFYSITEKFDTSTPMGRAMINVMAVFAQMEREMISQRVFDSKAKQMADGIKLGMAPFGYRIIVGSRSCRWEIMPQEAGIVQEIFRLYATGKWSYRSLAVYLSSRFKGERRRRLPGQSCWGKGKHTKDKWQQWSINNIIANPTYAGLISPDADVMARNLKPIIPYELYRHCEEIRNKRSPRHIQYQHATTSDHPLKGKIYCSCGRRMNSRSDRKSEVYYFCPNFHKAKGHALYARASTLLQDILAYLKTCRLDRETVQEAKRKLEGNSDRTEAERMRMIKQQKRSYERLQELYIDGEISRSFLKRKKTEITMRLQELQPKLGSGNRVALIGDIPTIIQRLNGSDSSNDQRYREKIVELFVEKLIWGKDHIVSLKVYDEFECFFPQPYRPQQAVSAHELIQVCECRKPTIRQIRKWNSMGLLPDTGRRFGPTKRYNLMVSVKRVKKIMQLLELGYNLGEIGRLMKGETVIVRAGVIAKKLGISRSSTSYWLRKLVKPVDIGRGGAFLYNLEEALGILQDKGKVRRYRREQT